MPVHWLSGFRVLTDVGSGVLRGDMAVLLIELTDTWLEYSETLPDDEDVRQLYWYGHEYMYYTLQGYNHFMLEEDSQNDWLYAGIAARLLGEGLAEHNLTMYYLAAQEHYFHVPGESSK
jgi:hypothetical protein